MQHEYGGEDSRMKGHGYYTWHRISAAVTH